MFGRVFLLNNPPGHPGPRRGLHGHGFPDDGIHFHSCRPDNGAAVFFMGQTAA